MTTRASASRRKPAAKMVQRRGWGAGDGLEVASGKAFRWESYTGWRRGFQIPAISMSMPIINGIPHLDEGAQHEGHPSTSLRAGSGARRKEAPRARAVT